MATFGSTLKELSNKHAKKQPKQVDQITKKAPFLDLVPFVEATHEFWNVYDELDDVVGAGFVDLNSPLPTVGATSGLKKVDLSVMGGKMEVAEDKARAMGGPNAYFETKLPAINKKTGMSTEVAIIYNNLRQYSIDHHSSDQKMVYDAGGSGNANYSIVAVRFEEGITQGLYSPIGFKQGAMLHHKWLSDGALYTSQGLHGVPAGVDCYGLRLKGYFGIQIAALDTVRVIANIDANNIPTAMMLDDILADIDADEGDTYLLCHRKCRNLLNKYKGDRLEMRVNEKHYSRTFTHWDDVPFVHTKNMMEGTEQNVVLT